jgi:pyridoxamine 5'-phosphate oxidase family protein
MSVFTSAEVEYLTSQQLGRLATAGPDGRPHVVPVAFRCNAEPGTIDIGGHGFAGRKKWRDVQANPWAAFVVDDVVSVSPWSPRMVEIRGRVELLASGGSQLRPGFDEEMIRIHPTRIVSYGLEAGQQTATARSVGK